MKVKREEIHPDADSSFKVLLTPNLNDLFYWHFHPEYEIVYAEATQGVRHIGEHMHKYEGSDLVLIGPYIPHLNFDYGVPVECRQVVVQMKENFLGKEFFSLPEMDKVGQLFERGRSAIAFYGTTKQKVSALLKKLSDLDHFDQLLTLLQVFRLLAETKECEELRCRPLESASLYKDEHRMQQIHRYIELNYQKQVTVQELAHLANLTTAAFCRYFKKSTGFTLTDYLNIYRINQAKRLLLHNKTVTEACFGSGFENLSHFNKTFKKWANENPSHFKKTISTRTY